MRVSIVDLNPKAAVLAALTSASLLATPALPALAAPTLDEVIVEVSETSYPIIKALSAPTFPAFTEKIGKLFLEIKPEKLGKIEELGIDVFNSVPDEKLNTFKGVVKEAFADLKTDSCTLVPLPPKSIADKFGAIATENVDAAKLKAFSQKWGPTISALAKTDEAICLPSVSNLDKLALAQAEIGRSFSPEESQRLASYATPTLKSVFTLPKLLPLVDDAKRLAPGATSVEKAAFQQAGKNVEKAANAEAQKAKLAALKARSAEIEAAKAAGKPVPAAAGAPAKPRSELEKEMAAEREKAAKVAAEKKAAAQEAELKRREELKEAEAARIAELKAKAKAIQDAKNK